MPATPVTLVSTHPPGMPGSMARYERMVAGALARHGGGRFQPAVVHLALREACLNLVPRRLRTHLHHTWVKAVARRKLSACSGLLHCLDGSHAYALLRLAHRSCVCTCHDVIPYLQMTGQLGGGRPGWLGQKIIRQSLAGAAASTLVLADSTSTAQDLKRACGDAIRKRIRVVPLALHQPPVLNDGIAQAAISNGRGPSTAPFILHLGNNAFYKNRQGAVRVFARLTDLPALRLVLAGPPPDSSLRKLVVGLDLAGRVDFVAHPDDRRVWELYRRAQLFLFPSIYEGFGWPPLEAMAVGCPVVCSDSASLPEVVGESALMAAPEDEGALANHCRRILSEPGLANSLIAKGRAQAAQFTLQRMAQGLMTAYDTALA